MPPLLFAVKEFSSQVDLSDIQILSDTMVLVNKFTNSFYGKWNLNSMNSCNLKTFFQPYCTQNGQNSIVLAILSAIGLTGLYQFLNYEGDFLL